MKARTRMLQIIKMQFYLMLRKMGFQFAFTVMMIYCMASFIVAVYKYLNSDVSSMYCAFTFCANNDSAPFFNYFKMLFPFLVVFPLAFSSMTDRLNQTTTYIFTRCSQKAYYVSLYINAFLGGFIVLFIPLFLNWFLVSLVFPHSGAFVFGEPYSKGFVEVVSDKSVIPFPWLFLKDTMAYAMVYDCFISIFSGVLSVFSVAISFAIKKYKIFALLPVFVILYICRILDMSSFDASIHGNGSYISLDPFSYVTITSLNGKRCFIIALFCFLIILFSLVQLWRMERKEIT